EQSDFDSNWPAPIEGGTSHQTRKKRVVKLVKSNNPPNDRMGINAPTLEKKIMDAAHPTGHPVWFDPRLEDKVIANFFNPSTGEGLAGGRYEGWILLGIYPGTEDYIGKALINRDDSDADINAVGKTYGSKEHTLSVAEMPSHDHDYKRPTVTTTGFSGSSESYTMNRGDSVAQTSSKGDGDPHNNMQPSIVACLIARKSDAAYYVT
ncbi:MAG: hypothetical protein HUJ11_00115, partial [Arenibacter algicola]|nr:hypothetical protein [Arenibacter algicola]